MIIGLTGTLASGKRTIAGLLKEKGFFYLSLSEELRSIMREEGVSLTRENLQTWDDLLREKSGPEYLARRVLERAKTLDCRNIVIDGIRNAAEAELLKQTKNFFLVAVDAPKDVRFRRMKERQREQDPVTWDDFLRIDAEDRGDGENSTAQGVDRCIALADSKVINEGDPKDIKMKVEELYSDLSKKVKPLSWDEYFMTFAKVAAQKSKDPSTKVGACIVDGKRRVIGLGYNGFPKRCDDDELPMAREGPFLETKYAYVVHAEPNAILNSTRNTDGCRMYVTLFPCNECAKLIIQAGITEVIFADDKYAGTDVVEASKRLFRAAGVKTRLFEF